MKGRARAIGTVIAVSVSAVALFLLKMPRATPLTVCELVGQLRQLDGRVVTVRSEVGVERGMVTLADKGCINARLLVEEVDSSPLPIPKGLVAFKPIPIDVVPDHDWKRQWEWHWIQMPRPVHLQNDASLRIYRSNLAEMGGRSTDCPGCPTSRFTATVTGRLDHLASHTMDARTGYSSPTMTYEVGFGQGKIALSRLVLESVSAVSITKKDAGGGTGQ